MTQEDKNNLEITIDGPSSSGKGTIAKEICKKLLSEGEKAIYIDSGRIYRILGFLHLHSLINEKDLINIVHHSDFQNFFSLINSSPRILKYLHSSNMGLVASSIAQKSENRQIVNQFIRIIISNLKNHIIIIDGRDIGTKVLPYAEIKIFLTATLEKRAKRRFEQLKNNDNNVTYAQIFADLKKRDESDINRAIDPLVKAKDAIEIDNGDMTISETLEKIWPIIENQQKMYLKS